MTINNSLDVATAELTNRELAAEQQEKMGDQGIDSSRSNTISPGPGALGLEGGWLQRNMTGHRGGYRGRTGHTGSYRGRTDCTEGTLLHLVQDLIP